MVPIMFRSRLPICCNLKFCCIPNPSSISLKNCDHHQCYKNSQEINSHVFFWSLLWRCHTMQSCYLLLGHYIQFLAPLFFLYGFASVCALHWLTFLILSSSLPPCYLSFLLQHVCGHYYCIMSTDL